MTERQGMLVLTRQTSQEIVITAPSGERIVIRVARIAGGSPTRWPTVRLAIAAPKSFRIDRGEIAAEKEAEAEKQQASAGA